MSNRSLYSRTIFALAFVARVVAVATVIVVLAFAAVTAALATQPDADGEHKVGICHRTASDSNPYVYIEVDVASLSPGHLDNADPGHKPTYWKSDGTFRGVAHLDGDAKDDYLAESAKDCEDFAPEVTPTPTPEPGLIGFSQTCDSFTLSSQLFGDNTFDVTVTLNGVLVFEDEVTGNIAFYTGVKTAAIQEVSVTGEGFTDRTVQVQAADICPVDPTPTPEETISVTPVPSQLTLPPTDTDPASDNIGFGLIIGIILLVLASTAVILGAAMSNGDRR